MSGIAPLFSKRLMYDCEIFMRFASSRVVSPFIFLSSLKLKEWGITCTYIHTADTGATSGHKESHYNLVRPAALVLGYDRAPGTNNRLEVETALTWKTYVTNVLEVDQGEGVSYASFFHS